MDYIQVVQFVQRSLRNRKELVIDLLANNGVVSMEHYRHCMGELDALNYVEQELSGLLEKQEHIDD